jgi:hypothetical protein
LPCAYNRGGALPDGCRTGDKLYRHSNKNVARLAVDNSDILIPFRLIGPAKRTQCAAAQHKPNLHFNMSAWLPKCFLAFFTHYANTILKHKIQFGFNLLAFTPDRWRKDFEMIGIRDEMEPTTLKDNARRIFKN